MISEFLKRMKKEPNVEQQSHFVVVGPNEYSLIVSRKTYEEYKKRCKDEGHNSPGKLMTDVLESWIDFMSDMDEEEINENGGRM